MAESSVDVPFPAPTRQTAGLVNGVETQVMHMSFADKIMITITQHGRLSQWVTVPLLSDNPTHADPFFQTVRSGDDALLPSARFAPCILLGAGGSARETMGQLYASHVANAVVTKSPEESRDLLLGLGLAKVELDRDVFLQMMDLVLSVL